MALIVHSLGAYATYPNERIEWRRADYDLNKLVKSLKGEHVKGFANLYDADKVLRYISNADRQPALDYFAAWAAKRLRLLDAGRVALVPVPCSRCTSYRDGSAPYDMAITTRQRIGRQVKVVRLLRFEEARTPSHKGGTRDAVVLERALKVLKDRPDMSGSRVVLLDDVMTTGSHIRACAAKLRSFDIEVDIAIVGARTVQSRHPTPFSIQPIDLDAAEQ